MASEENVDEREEEKGNNNSGDGGDAEGMKTEEDGGDLVVTVNEGGGGDGEGDVDMANAGDDDAHAGDGGGDDVAMTHSGGDDDRSKRVYVGNLSWRTGWQDLKDYMKDAGLDVTHAKIMKTPDGRSKGCGIVRFATVEGAQQAVSTLNDTELNGRQIFVREDREDHGGGGMGGGAVNSAIGGITNSAPNRFSSGEQGKSRRVYVGNLSWDVAWQDLKDHMRQAGEVVHAEVIMEHTGRSKGCGIVEYAQEEDAQEAINTLTDTELKGRMIFVREDRESSNQAGGGGPGGHGQNTSVYVWNLSPDVSWQDLKDHMRKAGNVDSAMILTNPQGESLCCGVVAYQRPQEAIRAIRELQESELKGQPMYVREDRVGGAGGGAGGGRHGGGRLMGRGGRGRGRGRGRGYGGGYHGGGGRMGGGYGGRMIEDGTQLFVSNLSYETTWRELKDHFRQCGDVQRTEVMSRGCGTVQFSNKEDAENAIERLNGSELQGRELEVRLDKNAR